MDATALLGEVAKKLAYSSMEDWYAVRKSQLLVGKTKARRALAVAAHLNDFF